MHPDKERFRRTKSRLFILFACLFIVTIGAGITLPVLPFYTERLALQGGATRERTPSTSER